VKSRTDRAAVPGVGTAWRISRHLFTARPPRILGERSWMRPLAASLAAILAATGIWAIGAVFWSDAKSWLTQVLVAHAWQRSLAAGQHVKPWPWAESWPVARLTVPRLGIERYVLSGGDAMPELGARHMAGTALPGEAGNSVIGALQEEDFAFLRGLPAQTAIEVDSMDARGIRYTVRYVQELDPRDVWITKQEGPARLTLITCAASAMASAGGPPCYVVSAYAARGEDLPPPGSRSKFAGVARPEQAARSAPPQNTIFGRKTRV
jgi:sortase A